MTLCRNTRLGPIKVPLVETGGRLVAGWPYDAILLMAEIQLYNQLRLVVYPIIYRVSYIRGGAGFLPCLSSFSWGWSSHLY